MSLNDEKYRAIRQLPDIVYAALLSDQNKIADQWRVELYYALKHYPWPSDKINVNGYTESYKRLKSIDDILKYVSLIDGEKSTKRKAVKKKK